MTRTKQDAAPNNLADLPILPSDTDSPTFAPTSAVDAMPTEIPDSVAETRSDPPATPQPSLLERMKAAADAEKLGSENEWQDIVAAVANDTATDSDVADVLFSSGRSIADLEAAVARQKKVIRLQALIADEEPANAAQQIAQAAFNKMKADQKQQVKEMKVEYRRVSGILSTAYSRSAQCKNARFDLDAMSREWGAFIPVPPAWTDQYHSEPCIAAQLLVEEKVNREIAARLGPTARTGCYAAAGMG